MILIGELICTEPELAILSPLCCWYRVIILLKPQQAEGDLTKLRQQPRPPFVRGVNILVFAPAGPDKPQRSWVQLMSNFVPSGGRAAVKSNVREGL